MKKGVVVLVVPRDLLGHLLYGDALTDMSVAAHAVHEAAGRPKCAEVLH